MSTVSTSSISSIHCHIFTRCPSMYQTDRLSVETFVTSVGVSLRIGHWDLGIFAYWSVVFPSSRGLQKQYERAGRGRSVCTIMYSAEKQNGGRGYLHLLSIVVTVYQRASSLLLLFVLHSISHRRCFACTFIRQCLLLFNGCGIKLTLRPISRIVRY
jgi:hypothetical protein